MFNPHIKFEMSTITCNEEMKGNAKCKNSRFQPPFGGLSGNAQGWVILSTNFRGKGGRPPTNFGVVQLESLGYHVVLFA